MYELPITFPLVPVAASLLHTTGKLLTWSSNTASSYGGSTGKTGTAIFDPADGSVTQRTITNTLHDMFCPGISTLGDGRIFVTGGALFGSALFFFVLPCFHRWFHRCAADWIVCMAHEQKSA